MTAAVNPPTHRLNHLDALRGLAAMSVLCEHYNSSYNIPYSPRLIEHTPLHTWYDGSAAVSLFFVLSGLVLSIKYFRDTPAPRLGDFGYGGFLIGRVCRIWIPYAIVLLLSAAAWRVSAQHLAGGAATSPWLNNLWRVRPTVFGVTSQSNLFSLNNDFNLLPQAWTLAIEIVLSALVPAGILLAGRSTVWLLMVTTVACLLGGLSPYAMHFAVGIAMAKHFRAIIGWLQPRPGVRLGGGLVGLCFYTWKHLAEKHLLLHRSDTDWFMSGLGAAMLLAVVSATPGLRAWLSRGIVHHIGRTSYSLYLSHFLVIFCVTPRIMTGLQHSMHWMYVWMIGLAATVAIAAILAEAVYWSAEVPAIAVGRRLAGIVGRWNWEARSPKPEGLVEARSSKPEGRNEIQMPKPKAQNPEVSPGDSLSQ